MIITFYSYKGGVGRTQLVANLASYLCYYQDKKVLVIDWDLEAPGLHFFFKQEENVLKKQGTIDLFNEYLVKIREKRSLEPGEVPFFSKDEHIQPVFQSDGGGCVDLIPAGKYDAGYSQRVAQFDWFDFYESWDGAEFIEILKKRLNTLDYDMILVDSRTGLSDYTGICNLQLPEMNVVLIGPTKQSFWGVKQVIGYLQDSPYIKSGNFRKPIIMPILSRIDLQSNVNTNYLMPKFQEEFKSYIFDLVQFIQEDYKFTEIQKQTANHFSQCCTTPCFVEIQHLKFTCNQERILLLCSRSSTMQSMQRQSAHWHHQVVDAPTKSQVESI
ncbi:MAG: ParA family protein [Spirochaetota bacterium]